MIFDGSEGSVRIGTNIVAEVKGWKFVESAEINDVSTIGTGGYARKRGSLKSAKIDVEAFCDPDDPRQNSMSPGSQITLTLVMTTGKQIVVPCVISERNWDNGGPSGVGMRNFSAESNGAWTIT